MWCGSCDGRWGSGTGWPGWSGVLVLGIRDQTGPKCMPGDISQEEEFKLAMK